MKTITQLLLLFLLFAPRMDAQEFGKPDTRISSVALFALILDPQKFDKASVQIAGVMSWHPEGSYLFVTRESYIAHDIQSAIEIPSGVARFPSGPSATDLEKLSGQVVWIQGLVDAKGSTGESPIITRIVWLKRM